MFADGSHGAYELGSGVGTNLNHIGTTEGTFLVAWSSSLSTTFQLRIEPNVQFIQAGSGQSLFFVGVSPVLRIGVQGQSLNPFVDAGVGVSVGTRDMLANDNFGSYFFFSPTAGAGVKFGRSEDGLSLFVRWLHHSNAGLFPPNEGIDSLYVLLGCRF